MNVDNEDICKERETIIGLQNQIRQELNEMGARSIDECLTILERHLTIMRDTAPMPLDSPPTHETVDLFAGIRPILPTRLRSDSFTGFLLLVDGAKRDARFNLASEVLAQLDIPAVTKCIEDKTKRKKSTHPTEQLKVVTVCIPEKMREATLFDIDSLALRYALCMDSLELLQIAGDAIVDKEKCYALAVSLRERCTIESARPKARKLKYLLVNAVSTHQRKNAELDRKPEVKARCLQLYRNGTSRKKIILTLEQEFPLEAGKSFQSSVYRWIAADG